MNQRLIIIISIFLFLLGIVGIYLSDSEVETTQQQSEPQVTYFITKRAMATGELLTKDDYEEKIETLTAEEPLPEQLKMVEGLYLKEAVQPGTALTASLLTKEKPAVTLSSEQFRYTVDLNKRYINNLNGLSPGAAVDVYLRFESPKREHENRSTIYRGESVVKMVKIFKNKKLLTHVMKGKKILSDDEKEGFTSSGILDKDNENYTVDIELTRSDLKKIYQIENKYEMIVFPAELVTKNKTDTGNNTKGAGNGKK